MSKLTNVSVDAKSLSGKVKGAAQKVSADKFRSELLACCKNILTLAQKGTPQRPKALITAAQKKQYNLRINFIPSFSQNANPPPSGFLRVSKSGGEWFYFRGKWYSEKWRIPAGASAKRDELRAERRRRMGKSVQQFVSERLESQGLFRRQWVDIGASLGITISAPQGVKSARGRGFSSKKRPQPPASYGRIQGGKGKLTATFFSPLLSKVSGGGRSPLSTSKWKPFDAQTILNKATSANKGAFKAAIEKRLKSELKKAIKS